MTLLYGNGTDSVSEQSSGDDVLIGKYTGYVTDSLTVSALAGAVNDNVLKTTGARTAKALCQDAHSAAWR